MRRKLLALPESTQNRSLNFCYFLGVFSDVSSHLCQDLQVLRILLVDPTRASRALGMVGESARFGHPCSER